MDDKYTFVTSFSQKGHEVYGKRFLESYIKHCPHPLWVWHESQAKLNWLPEHIKWLNLDRRAGRRQFLEKFKHMDGRQNGCYEYRLNAVDFCHKVFALEGAIYEVGARGNNPAQWVVWIDSDTVFKRDIDEDLMGKLCPDDIVASYLGRLGHDHSECGFVAYNMDWLGREVIEKMVDLYHSTFLFELPQWHDSYVFDAVRRSLERRGYEFHNISEGVDGMDVWPHTILGDYIEHNKGPRAKMEAYGSLA